MLIGVGRGGSSPPPPPSEPDKRISRIRLSSRWFTSSGPAEEGMSLLHGVKPRLPKEGVPPFHPRLQSCQHAIRPHRSFDPRPSGPDLSGLLRHRHSRRFPFARCALHASTFLPPFARRPLQTLHRSYGGSDSCRRHTDDRSPEFTCLAFPSFCPQPPDAANTSTSPFPSRLVLSAAPSRIGFVILRTDGSPPVALHLLSRERSYLRLQAEVLARCGLPPHRPDRPLGALG